MTNLNICVNIKYKDWVKKIHYVLELWRGADVFNPNVLAAFMASRSQIEEYFNSAD